MAEPNIRVSRITFLKIVKYKGCRKANGSSYGELEFEFESDQQIHLKVKLILSNGNHHYLLRKEKQEISGVQFMLILHLIT